MALALTDDHLALASTVAEVLEKRDARGAARRLLEAPAEELPDLWKDVVELGWLGLHVPEAHGGSGYGLEELVLVVEQLGRFVAPGPFVPTVIASAVIAAAGDEAAQAALLPGLADGSVLAGVAPVEELALEGGAARGRLEAVLGGGLASILLVPAGDDVLVLDASAVTVTTPENLDSTRRSAQVDVDGVAPAHVLAGARRAFTDVARLVLSAEAVGVAAACTE
jgi:3-oxochol-4-en-24-oyl-CoA dehydrogenase